MKNLLQLVSAAIFTFCAITLTPAQIGKPEIGGLKPVAQLPPELPQRVMGLAYDGENLWATIYLGQGRYAKLNPVTLTWTIDSDIGHNDAIATVAREFSSPGGVCFANKTLWPSGLAWVREALWISEFDGKIWRLPFGK